MPARKNVQEVPVEKAVIYDKRKRIVAVVLLVIAFIAGFAIRDVVYALSPQQENAVLIENFFADITGNGLEDYVLYAVVVINGGSPNFQQGQ